MTKDERLAEARALLERADTQVKYAALFWGMEKNFQKFDESLRYWDDIKLWLRGGNIKNKPFPRELLEKACQYISDYPPDQGDGARAVSLQKAIRAWLAHDDKEQE